MKWFQTQVLWLLVTLVVAGFAGATLVRFGPGFSTDERDLDLRYSGSSRTEFHRQRLQDQDLPGFYLHYIQGLVHGDLGASRSFGMPVSELLRQRAGVTLRLILYGVSGAWAIGLALAILTVASGRTSIQLLSSALSGVFLCLPVAVLALIVFLAGGPVHLVIALSLFPKVFRYARDLLARTAVLPHVMAARARGVREWRVFLRHIVPPALPALLALAGVSVGLAFGLAIPVEVVCDLPGIGQLAWKAALARDLPLLVSLTLVVTLFTLLANSASELARRNAAS